VGATIHEVDSRHVPTLSNPKLVIDVISRRRKRLTVRWSRRRAGVITSFLMTSLPSPATTRALARRSSSCSR
jgi:hypothetical protein